MLRPQVRGKVSLPMTQAVAGAGESSSNTIRVPRGYPLAALVDHLGLQRFLGRLVFSGLLDEPWIHDQAFTQRQCLLTRHLLGSAGRERRCADSATVGK